MGKIYTEQNRLTLYISTGSSLLEAAAVYLDGTDPSGSSIALSLSTTIEDESTGLVSYDVQNTDFTTAGTWTLWIRIAYIGGDVAYGEPFHLHIYAPGT